MESSMVPGRNTQKTDRYLLSLLVLCGLIPHGMLCLLQPASRSGHFSPAEIEVYSNFFVCQWMPFWLVFVSYLRLQKQDRFSPVSALCAALILLTYLPRFPRHSILTLAWTVPLVLMFELSGLLKIAEAAGSKVLGRIAGDRGILRAFWFWSLVFPAVIHISCQACTFSTTVVSPFQMLPFPGILLFDVLHRQQKQPPGAFSLLLMPAAVPLSLYLATLGPMERFQSYHLMSMGLGFVLLFLLLTIYNLDRWKKPERK